MHNLPPSKIIFSEVMFDKTRGISGELPEHIEFVKNIAIPQFEEWGYEVEVLHAATDYIDNFNMKLIRSKYPDRIGKKRGFPIAGMCAINRDIKIKAIRNYLKQYKDQNLVQYVGIAIDEPERLARLDGTNRISLLARYGYTEQMAYDLCSEYNLLSPIYNMSSRGGCWFCPNCKYKEFAHLKCYHPELWDELKILSLSDNLVSYNFKYNLTFDEVNAKVNAYIAAHPDEFNQTNISHQEE